MNPRLVRLVRAFIQTEHGKYDFSFPSVLKATNTENGYEGEYSMITGEFIHGINILEMENL